MKAKLVSMMGRSGLILRKHSPVILLVAGTAGVAVSSIWMYKSVLKADDILDETKKNLDNIAKAREIAPDEYTPEDQKKDLAMVYVRTGVEFAKAFGPPLILGLASVGSIFGSHRIMQGRNMALVAAYKLAEQSFADYRKRVVEEFGEIKDYQFKNNIKEEKVTVEVEEDGKKKKKKEVVQVANPTDASQYARYFDNTNVNWSESAEYNMTFLKIKQNHFNDRLKSKGHLFLNEVYDELGFERTQAGQVVGWVKGHGDDYIDFGIFDSDNELNRMFVNGLEPMILLDFNVDGIIYDLI